jgi:guanine deaminase
MKIEKKDFMRDALTEAFKNITTADGGPFGAVIVRGDKIIARAHNTVLLSADATAHAEINAIRAAGKKLGSFDLSECDLYTSCEPCPMCLMAAKWANIRKIYYAATRGDAASIGFRDSKFYSYLKDGVKTGTADKKNHDDAFGIMKVWFKKHKKDIY